MIRVLTIGSGGSGHGYDLTDDIEGLSYSNVDPGGDEQANFIYRRPWSTNLPEIAKGNLLVIEDGLDVLWQGRIGEPARGGGDSESVAVTGYGLGVRLKDQQLERIYVDSDLGKWQSMSRAMRIAQITSHYIPTDHSVAQDPSSGYPAIVQTFPDSWASPDMPLVQSYYDAGERLKIGAVYYDYVGIGSGGAWVRKVYSSDDDIGTGASVIADESGATSGTATTTLSTPKRWLILVYAYTTTPDGGANIYTQWRRVAVYGNHGLTPRSAGGGFYASDVIPDVIDDVDGVELRTNDATTLEIKQLLSDDTHEALIGQLHELHRHERTWGTWGPDDVLAERDVGYFDWKARPSAAEWFTLREACEDLDLSSEIDNLFDTVIVTYTDAAGSSRRVTRTLPSPELDAAGMSGRTARLSGGQMTTEIAEAFGDAVLAYMGGYAPARGSFTIAQPIRHATRGELPPHYLRADGAMVRIPDILPTSTLFTLDSTPDRRTTFPIKRVRVDLSGAYPKATVDIDQTNDLVSTLDARLGLAAQTTLG